MGKNVLITGASSGIGRCTSIYLAENNYYVYAGVRTEKDYESLKSEHKNIMPIYLDVLDEKSIQKAYEELKNKNISLEAIINNAGAVIGQPIEYINLEDLKYQFELNTIAPVAITQKFLSLMPKGKIINISSMASTGIFPYISPYCASKRAMDILFNSLSIELKNDDIKIISIKPGVIKTPIWNKSITRNKARLEKLPDDFKEKYGKELLALSENANKNNYKALEPQKVAQIILKALKAKKPKSSYCVGWDSIIVCQLAKLPQDFLNKIIRLRLKSQT